MVPFILPEILIKISQNVETKLMALIYKHSLTFLQNKNSLQFQKEILHVMTRREVLDGTVIQLCNQSL
jgi:hypothetical protein